MRDSKNIIIGALLITLMVMAVGYAAFAQTLEINGNAKIAGEWDVEITGIEPTYVGGASDEKDLPTFTSTTATFDTILNAPGDSATYVVTVENLGTIDAELDSISLLPDDAEGSPAIDYEIVSQPAEGSKLVAGGSTTVTIKVTYNSNTEELPSVLNKKFTGVIEYIQATN